MAYDSINIFLGSACNLSCDYCLQQKDDCSQSNRKSDGTFVTLLMRHISPSATVRLWGGEPLLYWKTIKPLIVQIHKHVGHGVRFVMNTNGTLLTKDIVDFANDHRVFMSISNHEEYGTPVWEQARRLNNCSMTSIFSSEQTTIWGMRHAFYERLEQDGRLYHPYPQWVKATDSCQSRFYMTHETVDQHVHHLRTDVKQLLLDGDDFARLFVDALVFERDKKMKSLRNHCCSDNILTTDLHGNTFTCHHSCTTKTNTGNIFKQEKVVIPILSAMRFSNSYTCKTCNIYDFCKGGCFMSNTHDVDCYLHRKLYEVINELEHIRGTIQ